jgi:hypothetical protein
MILEMYVLFQAADLNAINNQRLTIVLGLLTLTVGLATFLSCRTCLAGLRRLGIKNLPQNRVYAAFNRLHLYYWWAFGVLVIAHLMVAVLHTGLPAADDPEAGIHWWILGLGLFSLLAAGVVFFSCRVIPKLASLGRPKSPLDNSGYRVFYQSHAYYWLILGLLAAAHFAVGFSHSGIWPT